MSSKDNDSSTTKACLLSRIDVRELKTIKVAIRRHNIPVEPDSTPPTILRSLDDPADLIVHRRGEGQRPIFERDEIVVNQENEERIILASSPSGRDAHEPPTSQKHSRDSRSPRHSRSSSSTRGKSRSRSRGKYFHMSKRSRSKSRSRTKDLAFDKKLPCDKHKSERYRTRSVSPRNRQDLQSQIPRNVESHQSRVTEQQYKYGHNSRNREVSPVRSSRYSPTLRAGEYRPPMQRKKSNSPSGRYNPSLRPGEYRPPISRKKSNSPSGSQNRRELSDIAQPGPSKSSKSPDRDDYYEKLLRDGHFTGKERKLNVLPHHEGGYRGLEKDRKRSTSPYKTRDYKSERRSRSPRDYRYHGNEKDRRRSRSPQKRFGSYSRSERDRRSRSPYYSDGRRKFESRRYSRSPHRDGYKKYEFESSKRYTYSPPRMQPRYKDGGLWIPDAMLAQGVLPGFFGPPGAVMRPRLPRPPMNMLGVPPHLMFRPRPPLIYNQPYWPRLATATVTTSAPVSPVDTSSSVAMSSNINTSTSSVSNTVTTTTDMNAANSDSNTAFENKR